MKNLIFHPTGYFEQFKYKKPNLVLPVLILFLTGILDGVVNALGVEHILLSDITSGLFPLTKFLFFVLTSNLSFYGLILIQTLLFPLIIKKLGGTGGSRGHSFFIIGMSMLPILIQSIIHLIFPGTVWWQNFDSSSLLYFLSYSFLNLFNFWSIALLIIGFAKVYQVSYKKSSILYVQFLLKLIPLIILTFLAN